MLTPFNPRMLTPEDFPARQRRLAELACGLALETAAWEKDTGPLSRAERDAYLAGLADARAGLEAALLVLEKAGRRLARSPLPDCFRRRDG